MKTYPHILPSPMQLSSNFISRVEGLDHLPRLETLLLADNRLRQAPDLAGLRACRGLKVRSLRLEAEASRCAA